MPSNQVYFISDLHLGHRAILGFNDSSNKPLRVFPGGVPEMHKYLVSKWNAKVEPSAKVIVLGDIFLVGSSSEPGYKERLDEVAEVLRSLNGATKVLVMGNHDVDPSKHLLLKEIFQVHLGCYQFKRAICTHIPVHPSSLERFDYNIHGHLHTYHVKDTLGNPDPRYINVAVEQLDYTPKTYEELTGNE